MEKAASDAGVSIGREAAQGELLEFKKSDAVKSSWTTASIIEKLLAHFEVPKV